MKNLLIKVPGFRTNSKWKKIIAKITYPIMLLFIYVLLSGSVIGVKSSDDKVISLLAELLTIILIIIIPFVLITNTGNIRNKLPLFRSVKYRYKILASILTFIITVITLAEGTSYINKYHSPEYIKQEALEDERRQRIEEENKHKEELALKAEKEKEQQEQLAKEAQEEKEQKEQVALKALEEKEKNLNEQVQTENTQKSADETKNDDKSFNVFGWFNSLFEETEEEKKQALAEKALEEKRKKEASAKKAAEEKKQKMQEASKQQEIAAIEEFAAKNKIDNFELAKIAYYAKKEREKIKATAKAYPYNELLKSADTLKGKPIYAYGKITFIKETTDWSGNFKNTIMLIQDNNGNMLGAFTGRQLDCNKGDNIDVYGKINGYTTMTNGFGGKSDVPDIEISDYSLIQY